MLFFYLLSKLDSTLKHKIISFHKLLRLCVWLLTGQTHQLMWGIIEISLFLCTILMNFTLNKDQSPLISVSVIKSVVQYLC